MLSCSVMSDSLQPHGLKPASLLCPWGFFRQEYWSGLPCPPPGDLPRPGNKPSSPTLQADFLLSEPPVKSKHRVPPDPGIELGSPELQVDSLPAELLGKPKTTIWHCNPTSGHVPWENHYWKRHTCPSHSESHFLGRLIGSLGVPKERGVWNYQGGRKDKLFFLLYIP